MLVEDVLILWLIIQPTGAAETINIFGFQKRNEMIFRGTWSVAWHGPAARGISEARVKGGEAFPFRTAEK